MQSNEAHLLLLILLILIIERFFAVYRNSSEKITKGCHYLIKYQQAILLESVTDIIKGLNWDIKEKEMQQSIFLELSKSQQKIVNFLSANEMHIDAIVESLSCGFSI